MGLLDEIRAEEHGSGSVCRAGQFIASLTEEQQGAVWNAVAEGIQHSAIGRWLTKLGYRYSPESVNRHLVRRCKCPA